MSQPQDSQDANWIQPYYAMDKEQLLAETDPVTINQIRNTLGDQKFIDQWKLSEGDYNRIVEGQQRISTSQQVAQPVQTVQRPIPTSTVYTAQAPTGTVRRV